MARDKTVPQQGAWRRGAALVVGLLLAWGGCAPPLGAQSETDEFFIESIVVEGAQRFGAGIVVSESLLQEGQSYSERALRDAVHRIVRLPLVLDAEFALRKGSRRGRYQLVITVEEARRWFFVTDLLTALGDDRVRSPGNDSEVTSGFFSDDQDDSALFAGWRTSAGRFGVFSVAVDPVFDGKLQLGFSQYNLFGRNVQLQIGYLLEPLRDALDASQPKQQTLRLGLGIPLRGNHSLSFTSSYRQHRYRDAFAPTGSYESDFDRIWADLSWIYNTIDDPVFPTSGRFLRGGVSYRQDELATRLLFAQSPEPDLDVQRDAEGTEWRAGMVADFYRPISARDSLSLSLTAFAGVGDYHVVANTLPELISQDSETDLWDASLTLGYARFLRRDVQKPRWRELRWENEVELFDSQFSPDQFVPRDASSGFRIGSRLRYRTTWGVFSLGLDYIQHEDLP